MVIKIDDIDKSGMSSDKVNSETSPLTPLHSGEGDYKQARGVLANGDNEPAEDAIRRVRDTQQQRYERFSPDTLRAALAEVIAANEALAKTESTFNVVSDLVFSLAVTEMNIKACIDELERQCDDIGHEWISIDDEHAFCGRCGVEL